MVLRMDACTVEPPGAVAVKKATAESIRRPLAPSEKNNAAPVSSRKPKPRTREVMSRYKSSITPITIPPLSTPHASRRCPSPSVRQMVVSPTPSLPEGSQSAERRRPTTPMSLSSAPSSPSRATAMSSPSSSRPSTPVRDEMQLSSRRLGGGRMLDALWPSMRSPSTSFLPESASISMTKRDKPVSDSNVRPDHSWRPSPANVVTGGRRTPSRGKKAPDQLESLKFMENLHARLTELHRWPGAMNGKFSSRAMSKSTGLTDKGSAVGTCPVSRRGVSPTWRTNVSDAPGRGLQKTVNGVTRQTSLDGSGWLEHELSAGTGALVNLLERTPSWSHPSRTLSTPPIGSTRPSSPSRTCLSSSSSPRSMARLPCTRPLTPPSSSLLSYFVNLRKGKKAASQIEDAHQLRLLHNRYLQWRFVNVRANVALSIQRISIEDILYSVLLTISELHDSVILKRINMQQLRQEIKSSFILKDQMTCLEDWTLLEKEHCSSLLGAVESLRGSTLRLPLTGGARADTCVVKDALSSVVDIMQAMASSICQLLSGVEVTSSVVSELAKVAVRERTMLDECWELLALTAAMQVQESSLRAHLLQLKQQCDQTKGAAPNFGNKNVTCCSTEQIVPYSPLDPSLETQRFD